MTMLNALFDYFAGLAIGFVVGRNARNTAQIAQMAALTEAQKLDLQIERARPRPGWQVALVILALLGLLAMICGGH